MEFGVMIYKSGRPGNPESGRGKTEIPSPSVKSWRGKKGNMAGVGHLMLDLP